MKIIIFYSLMILGVITTGTAFAQESLISVETNQSNYIEGDTIIISGNIVTLIGDTQVTVQLFPYTDCTRTIMEKPRDVHGQKHIW